MKSYQSLFLRECLEFKRGVPNLSHAMLIAENRRNLRWTVAFLYQWLSLMQAIKHKPHVTQMIRFVLHILDCARCFVWGCPRWDRLLVFSRCDFRFYCTRYYSRSIYSVINRVVRVALIELVCAQDWNDHSFHFLLIRELLSLLWAEFDYLKRNLVKSLIACIRRKPLKCLEDALRKIRQLPLSKTVVS